MKPTLMQDKTIEKHGYILYRLYWPNEDREGGWSTDEVVWPENTTAKVYCDAELYGGEIYGGEIRGGEIWGGVIWGGVIWGGEIRGGAIWGGEIRGGEIWGGAIRGGVIRGGQHTKSPAMATRSDGYCFIVHPVDGNLRVWAGCRNFTWKEARAHWNNLSHPKRAESMRIIKFLRAQVKARENGE